MSADRRRWALRAILLLPTYWLLRDTVRLHVSDYVSLVVIPWAVLVLASWLLARRAFDPGEARLRLVLAVVAAVCAWGVLQVGRMATRVVLVPALLAAAACVAPPLGPAAAALGVLLAVLELALRLAPALLPVDARLALPLGARARLDCSFRSPDGCLPAEALQVFPPDLAFAYRPGLDARPAELIDLTAPLGEAARRGWGLYWIHDPRWNRRGNAAVATIVAHRLRHAGRED